MTDETGIDVIKVHINKVDAGLDVDFWYAHCNHCDWETELLAHEVTARNEKVNHVIQFKCFQTSRGAPKEEPLPEPTEPAS